MNDNVVKICGRCITEKYISNFLKMFSECKACNIKRVLKGYYDNKGKILKQCWDKYSRLKDLDHRFKALDEKLSIWHYRIKNMLQLLFLWTTNDSENKQVFFYQRNFFETTKKEIYHKQNRW